MAQETFCEAKNRSLEKLGEISLPNAFKKTGIILFVLLLVLRFTYTLRLA